MPIRTHRGRTAVYRRFWGWPVRSPKHLAGTLLALVAIGLGLGRVLPDNPGGECSVCNDGFGGADDNRQNLSARSAGVCR